MRLSRFAAFAWATLGFNILVILWGAYVRATISGAGCGSHWPTCNGEIIPQNPQIETIIEFTHRVTSGIALLLVLVLFLWALRKFPKGNIVRKGAGFSLVFILIEALLGAGLVLFELVADNSSIARAFSMAVHLANTFLLLGCLTLTAWWASGGKPINLRGQGGLKGFFIIGFVSLILLGMTGAVTALGDTLFPAGSLQEGISQDFSESAHFLIRLRIIHPIFAIITGIYLLITALIAVMRNPEIWVRRHAGMLLGLFFIQLIAGIINVLLLAPVWMQLLHLFLADAIWIFYVLLSAAVFSDKNEIQAVEQDRSLPTEPMLSEGVST